jgi:hypothetical protein
LGTIARVTLGLVARDPFDTSPLDPAWTVVAGSVGQGNMDADGFIRMGTSTTRATMRRTEAGAPTDAILVWTDNGQVGPADRNLNALLRFDVAAGDQYDINHFVFSAQGDFEVRKVDGGVVALIDGTPFDQPSGWRAKRLIIAEAGGQVTVTGRAAAASGAATTKARGNDLTLDPTAVGPVQVIDGTPLPNTTLHQFSGRGHQVGHWFWCGRDVVVTGLPAGFSVELDGPVVTRAPVSPVAGVATVDVDTFALPITTVRVLNAASVIDAEITPADGVWGGDVYEYSGGAGGAAAAGAPFSRARLGFF